MNERISIVREQAYGIRPNKQSEVNSVEWLEAICAIEDVHQNHERTLNSSKFGGGMISSMEMMFS